MFFSKPGEYESCKLFSLGHFVLIVITIILIALALKLTKTNDKNKIKKIIKNVTIIAWILEVIKITFNLSIGNSRNPNTYIPLYFCSLLLYAGILSSTCKGTLKRVGDIFLQTGGIVAGIVFLVFPTTSLPAYPTFHYISLQSFLFHGMMIYLGLLMNMENYVEIKLSDIRYYAGLIISISIIAYIVNVLLDANLMFISKDFPNSPISIIYKATGKFYPVIMTLVQAFPPFYVVYGIKKIKLKAINL